jgi:UDP-N-acetyl-D-galactosamine dehydrogenase
MAQKLINIKKLKIGVIGLGYVGLPLALELGKKFDVIGYDKSNSRIRNLTINKDINKEVSKTELKKSKHLTLTDENGTLIGRDIFIITVPTPILKNKKPDLRPLIEATKTISKLIKKNGIVIYESTVYPGATEEVCVPIIEKNSKFKLNTDFFVGYSPERINPGDKNHNLTSIKKIVSGSNRQSLEIIDRVYKSIIKAGTYRAESIKVAEAAKVIENIQRDVNIALINEFSLIFDKLGLNTYSVLNAAATKWNFIKFQPGLVGGHCIGIDPYYLTYKSKKIGYNPRVILAGRKINDSMSSHVISKLEKKFKSFNMKLDNAKIVILGITFKENCSDIRNSKAIDLYSSLRKKSRNVSCYDKRVNKSDLAKNNEIKMVGRLRKSYYDAIIIASPHDEIKKLGIKKIRSYCANKGIIFDIKSAFAHNLVDLTL